MEIDFGCDEMMTGKPPDFEDQLELARMSEELDRLLRAWDRLVNLVDCEGPLWRNLGVSIERLRKIRGRIDG